MLRLEDQFYSPVEAKMLRLFWDCFFQPLLEVVDIPDMRINSSSALLAAIRSGRVQYKGGTFTGAFNIRISRELATFAKFDKRTRKWSGRAGPEVIAASIKAKARRDDLTAKMSRELSAMESRVNATIGSLSFGEDLPLFAMDKEVRKSLYDIGVLPEIDERTAKKLRADYTDSQRLNIKNWNPEQVTRLREMVERIQTTGDNSSIRQLIEDEWHTSAAKARFLARQETSLFFSKLSMTRAGNAGVRRYRWSTSHDQRVRPDHKDLQGTIHAIDDPPIVDSRTGRRAHPGQDFGCRCSPIWVLE
jgi:SPP1 gp7 family putative phage head morphogenesis protein